MASNTQTNENTQELPPHKTVHVSEERVSCNGGGGALGHPLVYYDLDVNGEAHCFYCSAHFIRK